MPNEKSKALLELSNRIRGCFGHVDLDFGIGIGAGQSADSLRRLCQEQRLNSLEIEGAIRPVIKNWLENEFTDFSGKTRPWGEDNSEGTGEDKRKRKISSMVSDASWFFTKPSRSR